MSKKLKDLQWHPVALEGFPISMSDSFQGFVGLEECTDYGLDKESKKSKKQAQKQRDESHKRQENVETKQQSKRKNPSETQSLVVPSKRVKLSNGFVVESFMSTVSPSLTSETYLENDSKHRISTQCNLKTDAGNSKNVTKKDKPKLGEVTKLKVSDLTPEDMLMWSEFKLQEPIMRALTELGFKNPTKIQQLTLPAAIHGRRDILGAAETGSGKTLAFGLPILSGILKLKEKAASKNLDVYDIPFKKGSAKKKNVAEDNLKKKPKKSQRYTKKLPKNTEMKNKAVDQRNKQTTEINPKESSEDGYISGDSNSEVEDKSNNNILLKKKYKSADDYIKEIDVPIRNKDNSIDEGNDSDDENYVYLSEMLDSDDLADSESDDEVKSHNKAESGGNFVKRPNNIDDSDDSETEIDDDEVKSDEDEIKNYNDEVESHGDKAKTVNEEENDDDKIDDEGEASFDDESGVEQSDDEDVILGDDDEKDVVLGGHENDESKTAGGLGCVKVIDDVEMPGHVVVKTGKPLYALILTPTRELAIQVSRHLTAVAKYTGIRIATILGGMAAVKQERVLRSGPEVVVATPGRLWELIGQGEPHLQQLYSVKFLAIDETDRMLERGHFDELHPLLERLNMDEERKSARQNFVFSATLTLVHDLPSHMKGKKVTKRGKIINRKIEKMTPQQKIKRLIDLIGMTDPKVVDITTHNLGTAETLTECRITCSIEHKDAYLYYILKRHPGRSIVFCNSIGCVRRLSQIFSILKCNPLPLHACMVQRQRLKNLERFRDDPRGVLIATDVAARGLDIPDVDHVIQYQVPRTAENYVHRSGRTARANKEGINVLMVEPSEAYLYSKLCVTLNKTSEVPTFPVATHILSPLKELVLIAREIDALELKKKRVAQAHGWREKAARDMDMIIDDDDVPVQASDPTIDRALKAKRRQLEIMLSRPIFPRGFSFKYPSLNDPNALSNTDDNALQVMKKALATGELKKEKRRSKNAPLLKLGKETKINKKSKNKKIKIKKK